MKRALTLLMVLALLAGCEITRSSDGEINVSVDPEALQDAIASGEQILAIIERIEAGRVALDDAEFARELAKWEAAYNAASDLFAQLQDGVNTKAVNTDQRRLVNLKNEIDTRVEALIE